MKEKIARADLVDRQIANAPGVQAAIRRGELAHSMINDDYWAAMYRANYYAWAMRRGFPCAGGDPLTGRRPNPQRDGDREEGRLVHAVQARYWFKKAEALRIGFRDVLERI